MTTKELANMAGLTDNNARGILDALVEFGCAKVVGVKTNAGVKRAKPAKDYRIDEDKLEAALSTLSNAIKATQQGFGNNKSS
jgi:hypothetical protein